MSIEESSLSRRNMFNKTKYDKKYVKIVHFTFGYRI